MDKTRDSLNRSALQDLQASAAHWQMQCTYLNRLLTFWLVAALVLASLLAVVAVRANDKELEQALQLELWRAAYRAGMCPEARRSAVDEQLQRQRTLPEVELLSPASVLSDVLR